MSDLEKAFATIYKRIHQDPFYFFFFFLSYFTQNEPTAKVKQAKLEELEKQLKDIQQYLENK